MANKGEASHMAIPRRHTRTDSTVNGEEIKVNLFLSTTCVKVV